MGRRTTFTHAEEVGGARWLAPRDELRDRWRRSRAARADDGETVAASAGDTSPRTPERPEWEVAR